MGWLENRFFMDDEATRKREAWINPPENDSIRELRRPGGYPYSITNPYYWHAVETKIVSVVRPKETIPEWLSRVYEPMLADLLNPGLVFEKKGPQFLAYITDAMWLSRYHQLLHPEYVPDPNLQTQIDTIAYMYRLRLRHDCARYRIIDHGVLQKELPISMFDDSILTEEPASIDVTGKTWLRPTVPEDTANTWYCWNAVQRGESVIATYLKLMDDAKRSRRNRTKKF